MKSLYQIVLLTLLLSCSSKTESNETQDVVHKQDVVHQSEHEESSLDSSPYLNKIDYFPETGDFYIFLDSKRQLSSEEFDALSNKREALIYEEDELARYEFPMQLAKEEFDLSSLPQELQLYDEQHQFVARAKLVRTEYLISFYNGFIATYKPEAPIEGKGKSFYCLSPDKVTLEDMSSHPIQDEGLSDRIKTELNIKPEYIWNQQHVSVQPYDLVLSFIAFHQANGKTISYLTEFRDNTIKVLKRLDEEYMIAEVLPIPIEINGMPVLLVNIVLPESGALDEYMVGIYNGSEYELSDNKRIELKKY
jgi:hypothetical protein